MKRKFEEEEEGGAMGVEVWQSYPPQIIVLDELMNPGSMKNM